MNGDLVTQGGQYVLGSSLAAAGPPPTFNADLGAINIPVDAQSVAIGADGVVTYTNAAGQQIAGQIAIAKFPNPGGLTRLSDNLYGVSPNSGVFDPTNQNNGATPTAGTASWGGPGAERPRRSPVGHARDVERRPRAGVHLDDHRAARLPGQRADDHDLGLDARRARQPEALVAPVAGGGGAGRAERVRARSRTAEGDLMIEVHHGREERPLLVNDDLIETVEATPDTVLTLTTGKKLIVRETPAEIVALIVEFRRRMQSGPRVIERD